MFFFKNLSYTLQLPPSSFKASLLSEMKDKLYATVEGTCTGRYGYIIAVVSITDYDHGNLLPGSGVAEYTVKYKALVYKPFKGEVVDGVVGSVNKMGFFAEIGPLQCFVSSHCIPAHLKFDPNSNPPAYVAEEQGSVVEKGKSVRIKVIGTRVDATEIFAIGTIKDDFLGPLED